MDDSNPAVADHAAAPQSSGQASSEAEQARPSSPDPWAEWDAFVEGRPDTGFMQSSWWIDF